MNIEIKISGETTDQTLVAILASIAVITGGKSESIATTVTKAAETVKEQTTTAAQLKARVAKEKSVADQVSEALAAAPVEAEEETAPETPQPAPTVKTAKSKYTLEVVRAEAIAVSKISNEKREEVKALIATHGGVKVTDLSADVYDAFMADLAKLK